MYVVVAPFVGAGIEINRLVFAGPGDDVAPFVGAGIEIGIKGSQAGTTLSRTLRGCGD